MRAWLLLLLCTSLEFERVGSLQTVEPRSQALIPRVRMLQQEDVKPEIPKRVLALGLGAPELLMTAIMFGLLSAAFVPHMFVSQKTMTDDADRRCRCTVDGVSGGVQTNMRTCAHHLAGETKRFDAFCYVVGGSNCLRSDVRPSTLFAGAAWRPCDIAKAKEEEDESSFVRAKRPEHLRAQMLGWFKSSGRSLFGVALLLATLGLFALIQYALMTYGSSDPVRNHVSNPRLSSFSIAQWICSDGQYSCQEFSSFAKTMPSPPPSGVTGCNSPFQRLVDPYGRTNLDGIFDFQTACDATCASECKSQVGWTPVKISGVFPQYNGVAQDAKITIAFANKDGWFESSNMIIITRNYVLYRGLSIVSEIQTPIDGTGAFSVVVPLFNRSGPLPIARIVVETAYQYQREYRIYSSGSYVGETMLE